MVKSCFKILLILGGLGLAAIVGLVVIVGNNDGPDSNGTGASEGEPTTPSYYIGDIVKVQDVSWTVLEVEDHGDRLKSDNAFQEDARSSGRFIEVRFQVESLSTDGSMFGGVPLRDSRGRDYDPFEDRIWYLPDDQTCVLENLNPNVPKVCAEIYEVAADAEGLTFVATDLNPFMGGEAEIQLRQE